MAEDTPIQIFYDDNYTLSEENSVIKSAGKGATEVFFEIPADNYGLVRIDIDRAVNIGDIYVGDDVAIESVFSLSFKLIAYIAVVVIFATILTVVLIKTR